MPYAAQARRVGEALELSARARHTLIVLASYIGPNDNGWCKPSVGTLARAMGVDPRTVARALAELRTAGAVRTVSAPGYAVRYRLEVVTFEAETGCG